MSGTAKPINVVFEQELNRSAAYIDGKHVGECEFTIDGSVWSISHTGVDQAYSGRGIAKMLVLKVIEEARNRQVRINPICSYAKRVMEGNEEFSDPLQSEPPGFGQQRIPSNFY